ncbi:MAG: heparinase II/III-family protein, partial [Sphingomonadales bacterium]|nr:heparinase II/III-family protein [Sphingomonadales bacterium]
WLKAMTRPDGKFPLFNDCAYGISPTYGELHTYASTLGFKDVETSTNDSTHLKNSGYVVKNTAAYSLFADVGNIAAKYLPGHTHNDIFNFEFFAHGQPVIVDTGTSTYEIGDRRSLERSTRSHNTVQFGDDEQNETWGGFRVGRRAKLSNIFCLTSGPSTKASGTAQHFSNNRHERIFMMAENTITIHDTADGLGAVARFHFHPDCDPEIQGDGLHVQNIHMTFSGCTSLNLVDYDYAPEFNIRKSAKVLEVAFEHTLETRITL